MKYLTNFFSFIDLRDIVAVTGLALLGYGAYLIYPPAAFMTVGAVLIAAAVWRYVR